MHERLWGLALVLGLLLTGLLGCERRRDLQHPPIERTRPSADQATGPPPPAAATPASPRT